MSRPPTTYDARFDALATVAYRVAYRILGDREEARDVAQEALARAYARWRRVEHYAEPWVARVAGNLALGVLRKQRQPAVLRDEADANDFRSAVDDRQQLVALLRDLPTGQRDTLLLRYVADLPEADVARLLGCSVGTVKSQAHRALKRLRPELADTDSLPLPDPSLAIDPRSA